MRLVDSPQRRRGLDATAASAVFLSQVLLSAEAGVTAQASLSPAIIAQWPGERNADTEAGLGCLEEAVRCPASADALRADYQRLFVGPGTMLACPWESVHRDEEGLVFGSHTMLVRRAYAEHGLAAPRFGYEPDDHIGLEAWFVSHVALRTLDALDAGRTDEAARLLGSGWWFVQEHLAQWAPDLAALVIDGARTSFYRGVGYLLRGSLSMWAGAFGGLGPCAD